MRTRGNASNGSSPRAQRGAQAVDFAFTFLTFIVILVGLVELIRALWMWTLLGEATRRAARIAAVCDVNDPAIYRAATELPGLGLAAANVAVSYRYCVAASPMSTACDSFQTVPLSWGQIPTADTKEQIQRSAQVFIRVGIKDFSPSFLTPWKGSDAQARSLLTPSQAFLDRYFETVLPAESLGWNPTGGSDQRGAFGPCP